MASMLPSYRAVPLALAAAALLIGGAPARAQGMIDGLMSTLGLRSDEKPDIDYRERAPLVVPPKLELRPPQQSAAKSSAAWPTDPTVVAKRKEERERRVPRTETYSYRMGGDKTTLSVDEMRSGRVAGAGLNTSPKSPFDDPLRAEQFDPEFKKQMRDGSKAAAKNQLVAGQEPERNFLTDPPPGYRMPAAGNLTIPGKAIEPKALENEDSSPWAFWRRNNQN